ncbi:hypothetical protein BSKO_12597 [Bryopsis sp. KO-2023]|nr:hypothetical protein BSKO_12597 [Bryopsis sp. KO-2023]
MKAVLLGFCAFAIFALVWGEGLPRQLLQDESQDESAPEEPATVDKSQTEIDLDLIDSAESGNIGDAEAALEENAKVSSSDGFGWTALHFAALAKSPKLAKLLLGRGADVDAFTVSASRKRGVFTGEKSTPLHVAGAFGAPEVAKVLIDEGANVNLKDQRGWTPLMKAARFGHAETAKVLLDAGAEFEESGSLAPLHFAAVAGHLDIVKILLEKGPDVNAKTGGGDTALQYAAEFGNYEIAKVLLEAGADKSILNKAGKSPGELICIKKPECTDQAKLEELFT